MDDFALAHFVPPLPMGHLLESCLGASVLAARFMEDGG
jgi:hypothetical protein